MHFDGIVHLVDRHFGMIYGSRAFQIEIHSGYRRLD